MTFIMTVIEMLLLEMVLIKRTNVKMKIVNIMTLDKIMIGKLLVCSLTILISPKKNIHKAEEKFAIFFCHSQVLTVSDFSTSGRVG